MKYLKCIDSIFSSFHFADRIQENKDNSGVKTGTGKVKFGEKMKIMLDLHSYNAYH